MDVLWKLATTNHCKISTCLPYGRASKDRPVLSKPQFVRLFTAIVGEKPPSKMDKACLARCIAVAKGIIQCQRKYRTVFPTRKKAMELLRRKIRRTVRNKVCPITLEPLQEPVFRYVGADGYVRGYQLKMLVDYILSSGNGNDPVTRTPFTELELKRMDKQAEANNLQCKSVYSAVYGEDKRIYQEEKLREETVGLLEIAIYDAINDVLDMYDQAYTDEEFEEMKHEFPTALRSFKDFCFALAVMDFNLCIEVLDDILKKMRRMTGMDRRFRSGMMDFMRTLKTALTSLVVGIEDGQFIEVNFEFSDE